MATNPLGNQHQSQLMQAKHILSGAKGHVLLIVNCTPRSADGTATALRPRERGGEGDSGERCEVWGTMER